MLLPHPSESSATSVNPLLPFLERRGFVLLDGGLASALEARGHRLDDALWSAGLLLQEPPPSDGSPSPEEPHPIVGVHLDFLRAGADVITTASYQASFEGFAAAGVPDSEAAALLLRSVSLAKEAITRHGVESAGDKDRLRPLVAASIGPYGAFLADGSEYRGDYDLDAAGLLAFHGRRLDLLADSGADLLACETIPSRLEARVLTRLLARRRRQGRGTPAWLSFCCRDGLHLADGSLLEEVVAEVAAEPSWLALGVNCTAAQHIVPLLGALRRATHKPAVVYPNSGEAWDATDKTWSAAVPGGASWHHAGVDWWRRGARLLGGCCRTTAQDIANLRQRLTHQLKTRSHEKLNEP